MSCPFKNISHMTKFGTETHNDGVTSGRADTHVDNSIVTTTSYTILNFSISEAGTAGVKKRSLNSHFATHTGVLLNGCLAAHFSIKKHIQVKSLKALKVLTAQAV